MSKTSEASDQTRSGRKEVLTLDVAKKIAAMVRRLPDVNVPVTWKNIEAQVKKQFQIEPRRNVLATKAWGGKKLIWEAYEEASQVEKRLRHQSSPKYADSSRAALRARIAQLESKIVSLQTELEITRDRQYDELNVLWARNTPLHQLLQPREDRAKEQSARVK